MPMPLPVMSPESRRLRSQKAMAVRWGHDPDVTVVIDAELRTSRLADLLNAQVDHTPPLSADQRLRLTRILVAGVA